VELAKVHGCVFLLPSFAPSPPREFVSESDVLSGEAWAVQSLENLFPFPTVGADDAHTKRSEGEQNILGGDGGITVGRGYRDQKNEEKQV
jgi:hypothetical protein